MHAESCLLPLIGEYSRCHFATEVTHAELYRKSSYPAQAAGPKPPAPFDPQLRHTVADTARHLKTSVPTVYKLIKANLLESFKEGRRTFITGRSIAARSLPPAA